MFTVTSITASVRTNHMPLPDPGSRGREAWSQTIRTPRRAPRPEQTPASRLDFSRLIDVYV